MSITQRGKDVVRSLELVNKGIALRREEADNLLGFLEDLEGLLDDLEADGAFEDGESWRQLVGVEE